MLYDMLALRQAIFVVEQSCAYQDQDGLDKAALHLLVFQRETVVAGLRLLPPGNSDLRVRIGRVAVSSRWRRQGVARALMSLAIDKVRQDYASHGIYVSAQTYLQAFYQSCGFEVCGAAFLEDGIPHRPMEMPPQSDQTALSE